MELFYSQDISSDRCLLGSEESAHCARVLRHRAGDIINVIDGLGTMYECRITDDNPRAVEAEVLKANRFWGSHPYHLTLAVCPTKNSDRYEWFAEKATEIGVDRIVPVIGDRSERKVFKTDRLRRILISAAKQSLKATVPEISEPMTVKDFIKSCDSVVKLIAYCFEGEKIPITEALKGDIISVLIGPEGDFSPEEATLAIQSGFTPIHLGPSRLRTETAALTAAEAVYLKCMEIKNTVSSSNLWPPMAT